MSAYTTEDRRRVIDAQYRRDYIYKRYAGIPTSPVPAQPASAHATRLLNMGWSARALAERTRGAISTPTILNTAALEYPTISRATANAILALPITYAPNDAVSDEALIPTASANRRVRALLRLGWNHQALQDRCGIDTTHFARGTYTQGLARRWRTIDDLYRQLCMTPGPSKITAIRAERANYAPPLAWDDIDSPLERVHDGAAAITHRADLLAEMRDLGFPLTEAIRRLNVDPESLRRWCSRHGHLDTYRTLQARDRSVA